MLQRSPHNRQGGGANVLHFLRMMVVQPFFKIGKKITIESSTRDTYFKIEINVESWKQNEDSWDFDLTEKREGFEIGLGYGTKIVITDLYETSKLLFNDNSYLNVLKKEIELENWYNISKGMYIEINNVKLEAKNLSIKEDEEIGLKIGRWQHEYPDGVNVRIICGIGERGKKEDGGWYIFCNDRLILAAEQTSVTGWTGGGRRVQGGPEYHGQYERFRGFVFFESQNPSYFPWNTAKTGLNPEHPLYLNVKSKMIDMMKDVIAFLNNLKGEKDGQGRGKNLPLSQTEKKLETAKSFSLRDVAVKTLKETKFSAPETIKPNKVIPQSNVVVINYEVDTEQFNTVSTLLNTTDPKEVGLKTFIYYLNNEE